MGEKVNPKISIAAEDFYRARFGSVRKGVTYVLDALPLLLDQTRQEIEAQIPGKDLAQLRKALSESKADIQFDGALVAELAPNAIRSQLQRLPLFARVVLELDAFMAAGRRVPKEIPGTVSLAMEVSREGRVLAEGLGAFKAAASFLLERFVCWIQETLREAPQELLKKAPEALAFDGLENPVLAGRLFPMRYRTLVQLGQADSGAVANLPVFAAVALEFHAMTADKKVKKIQASPKVPPAIGDGLAEIFGNVNSGSAFAISVFPRVFRQTLAEELRPNFPREEEWKLLGKLLSNHDLGEPETSGDLLLTVIGDAPVDFAERIRQLSPFGRICLELMLASRKKGKS